MRQSTPDLPTVTTDPHDPDLVTVQAPSAEEALAAVHAHFGAEAEIVTADRALTGGLWGFFPKQVVHLTARRVASASPSRRDVIEASSATVGERLLASRSASAGARPAPRSARSAAATRAPVDGLDGVLARLSAAQDDEEEGLGAALRRHLGVTLADEDARMATTPARSQEMTARTVPMSGGWTLPAVTADTPRITSVNEAAAETPTGLAAALATLPATEQTAVPAMPATAEAVPAPAVPHAGHSIDDVEYDGPAGSPWSGRGLLMLGLPRGFVDAVLAQEPSDDAAWTYAVARTLMPLCRPLPSGSSVLAGPRAERLSRAMGLPLVRLTATPRGRTTFAAACSDSARARGWIAANRGQRWLHLVVGGADWRGLLFDGPLAVSWVGDDAVGDAIRAAHDLGMVLGPGLRTDGSRVVEASPIDLAVLLRDLLGGRR